MGLGIFSCPCCPKDDQNREPLLKHGQSYCSLGPLGNVGPTGLVKENASDNFAENRARSTYGRVFGSPLVTLEHDGSQIPTIVERMMTAIEETGINAEGLYRKNGLVTDVKALIRDCNEDPDSVNFAKQHIHVLATAFKTLFRDLPEPLLCYGLYDEFVDAASNPNEEERMRCVLEVKHKLPQQNIRVLDRLLGHLARVAKAADNRMTANSLAIIFAPNILQPLQPPPSDRPDQIIANVKIQTACIQCMIEETIKKLSNGTLGDPPDSEDEDRL
ncbi:unconventional myosin-IXa-like [Lineus longissimus]|uniref:unconventional myosin-IXa-like n=1 Tax=Lineus longissimus TaxID=88925 RepID=UPI002B4D5B4D